MTKMLPLRGIIEACYQEGNCKCRIFYLGQEVKKTAYSTHTPIDITRLFVIVMAAT